MRHVTILTMLGCSLLVPGGCSSSDEDASNPMRAGGSPSLSASTLGSEVSYGAAGVISTESGDVEYVVSRPEVVTLHSADYDADSPTATKPGKAMEPMVRVRLKVRGISGRVATGSEIQLTYEASDGTLAGETVPLMTYEETDPISSHPTTVSPGQKTAGEIFFDSGDGRGKVIAGTAEGPQITWRQ